MFKLVPSWAHHDEEFWKAIKNRNLWFIKLRYGAVGMLLLFLFFAQFLVEMEFSKIQLLAILIITISILAYNIIFHFLRKLVKYDAAKFNPLHLSVLQMIFDLLALLLLVYYTGGIESPLQLFFVFHMIIGSLILPGFLVYALAGIVIAAFIGFSIAEYLLLIPHHHLNGFLSLHVADNPVYLITVNAVFTFGIFMIVLLANKIANQLYRREQQLLESLDKINAAEKEKQKYIMGIVHEIKTPLAAVHSYLDLILQKFLGPLDETVELKLRRAKARSEEAVDLINSVMKISRLRLAESVLQEDVDVNLLVNKLLKKLRPNASTKEVKLSFSDKREIKKKIIGDNFLIQIALSNVLSNAIKYVEMNGIVETKIEEEGSNLVVEVCDNGVGIPQEEQEKVFKDFYRATNIRKSVQEGSGIGLSVVKQIVEKHGGSITIKSPSRLSNDKNPGTTLRIILPLPQAS